MLTYADVCGYVGSIINQFAMDEHDGHLRVATTRGEMWAVPSTSESAITILNKELAVVGLLSGLAPGAHFTCFTSTNVYTLSMSAVVGLLSGLAPGTHFTCFTSTNVYTLSLPAVVCLLSGLAPGIHFTCFTSTNVYTLSPEALGGRRAHLLCSFHARGLKLLVYEALSYIRFTLVA